MKVALIIGAFICPLLTALLTDKFSIMTPTYERDIVLKNYLDLYAVQMPAIVPELHEIFIIWMNTERNPYESKIVMEDSDRWKVPVHFMIPPKNNLNYRFALPESLVVATFPANNNESKKVALETEAVFTLDDDLRINPLDIQQGFATWKNAFNGTAAPIVGFVKRDYVVDNKKLKYVISNLPSYTLLLTGASFLSKAFLDLYNNPNLKEPCKIRQFVSDEFNAEDIGMNFLVSAFFPNIKPIWCPDVKIDEDSKVNRKGLSYQPQHGDKRSKALNYYVEVFGRNPLQRVYLDDLKK